MSPHYLCNETHAYATLSTRKGCSAKNQVRHALAAPRQQNAKHQRRWSGSCGVPGTPTLRSQSSSCRAGCQRPTPALDLLNWAFAARPSAVQSRGDVPCLPARAREPRNLRNSFHAFAQEEVTSSESGATTAIRSTSWCGSVSCRCTPGGRVGERSARCAFQLVQKLRFKGVETRCSRGTRLQVPSLVKLGPRPRRLSGTTKMTSGDGCCMTQSKP